MSARRDAWVCRTAPGLAPVLLAELRRRRALPRGLRPTVSRQRNHDLVLARTLRPGFDPRALRVAEEVHGCPAYGRYKLSRRQLSVVASRVGGARPVRLVVTAEGRHFDHRVLRRWLGRELAARGVRVADDAAAAVFVFCIDAAYYVCLPHSTSRDAEGRRARRAERPGSLPPPVAAALALVADPSDADTVLDPVCGSGTLLAEARALAPRAELVGLDIDRRAIAAARRNLDARARLEARDSTATGLAAGSVSLVLANLPFGKQFGDRGGNAGLYRELVREWQRLAAVRGWRAVVLTADRSALHAALAGVAGLRVDEAFRVKVRGEPATAYRLSPGGGP